MKQLGTVLQHIAEVTSLILMPDGRVPERAHFDVFFVVVRKLARNLFVRQSKNSRNQFNFFAVTHARLKSLCVGNISHFPEKEPAKSKRLGA
ncbi:MAG: hypothetical protein M3126_07805 [Candidatus Eremiobacteraeota bacterium]|nr:hypothetical protein [Candidatus Eremiobacteraeota bacterium]